MDEEGTVMEVHLVSIGKQTAKRLAQKLHKRKFYIITHFSLNKREECTYLRLSADKAKIFQTAKQFTLPQEKVQEFFHPAQCTIPHALASPKKRRLSVGGTIAQVYELKQGSNWKRRDVLLSDNSTGKKICCKLWGDHATKITETNKGSTVTIENVEVDVYNDNHQLRSTNMTTIQVF
ncbi:hypothetical protein HOLleu_02960 [Holothuria leucospilota]|uniref:Uncharacterized protein n=1 Tax=Holothuria leucospilota TaxID=206669 RepID=A0A9Q1CR15_HOLLE|nr:hypothetical protein HOLleu_02960 [Holothuria leucospilota]